MSLRWSTPCDEPDLDGKYHCPYMDRTGYVVCENWCSADEPEDIPDELEFEVFDEPEEWAEREDPTI